MFVNVIFAQNSFSTVVESIARFKRVVLFRTLKRVVARYLLFSKFNTLLCLIALLVCARFIVLSVSNQAKEFTTDVCS